MNRELLQELNHFIGKASKATYAGGGGKTKSQRSGFNELEYREGDWYYRDSYTGFIRSWGQEVVWYKDNPFWSCLYGGGMYHASTELAHQTFEFLKQALSAGEKEGSFQPRGPSDYSNGGWQYICEVFGSVEKFHGNETITHNGMTVFTHDFIGGLVIGQYED